MTGVEAELASLSRIAPLRLGRFYPMSNVQGSANCNWRGACVVQEKGLCCLLSFGSLFMVKIVSAILNCKREFTDS